MNLKKTSFRIILASCIVLALVISTLFINAQTVTQNQHVQESLMRSVRALELTTAILEEYLIHPLPRVERQLQARIAQYGQEKAFEELLQASRRYPEINILVNKNRDFLMLLNRLSVELDDEFFYERKTETLAQLALVSNEIKLYVIDILSSVNHQYKNDFRLFTVTLGVGLTALLLLICVVLLWIRRGIIRPLLSLEQTAGRISEGDYSSVLPVSGESEFATLALSFTRMQHSVARHIRDLNAEKEKLVTILRSIGDGVIAVDSDGNVIVMNPVAETLTGWSETQACGRSFAEVFKIHNAQTGKPAENPINRVLETGKIVGLANHTVLTSRNGMEYQIADSASPIRDQDGRISGIVLVFRDVTEAYKVADELEQETRFNAALLESVPGYLYVYDDQGKLVKWNKKHETMTGYSAEELYGKTLADWFDEPDYSRVMQAVAKVFETGYGEVVANLKIKDGSTLLIRSNGVPLTFGGRTYFTGVGIDITEEVRLQNMMIQSEKMLSVGGLAAGMAHEINNPLAGMMQSAQVLESRLSANLSANREAAEKAGTTIEAVCRYMQDRNALQLLATLNESGRRVAKIVNNMLSFARKSEAQVSSVDLPELITRTIELASTDYDLKKQYDFRRIRIIREIEADIPLVPCEEGKIQQVLLNLLRNGAQALQGAKTPDPCFIIRLYRQNSPVQGKPMVTLELEDNGPGMSEAVRKRVFEPFFTTKPVGEGTGLGLSVSYFIITENHRGEMEVRSTEGAGAVFTVRLPL